MMRGPTEPAARIAAIDAVHGVALASLSNAWLRHSRLGPLEWLWRCGTYWRWLPNHEVA
jgi:uncharacterized protein